MTTQIPIIGVSAVNAKSLVIQIAPCLSMSGKRVGEKTHVENKRKKAGLVKWQRGIKDRGCQNAAVLHFDGAYQFNEFCRVYHQNIGLFIYLCITEESIYFSLFLSNNMSQILWFFSLTHIS